MGEDAALRPDPFLPYHQQALQKNLTSKDKLYYKKSAFADH